MATNLLNYIEYLAKSVQKMLKSRRFNEIIITHANIFASVLLKSAANILNSIDSSEYFCVSWTNFNYFYRYIP